MTQKKLALVLEWQAAADALQAAKADEAAKKAAAVAACFPTLKDGVNNIALPRGYVFKATHYPNHRLDLAKTNVALAALRALGDGGKLIAEHLVKFSADLRIGEYRKLGSKERAIIDQALTVTPSTPKCELVESA